MSVTLPLSKPIEAHGRQYEELELREPTGADLAACGFPFKFTLGDGGNQTVSPDAAVIAALISRLGNIPPGSVGQLSVADWAACMGAVFGFFGTEVPTSSTATLTLPGSGNGSQQPPSH